jgi:hypothetical protein
MIIKNDEPHDSNKLVIIIIIIFLAISLAKSRRSFCAIKDINSGFF